MPFRSDRILCYDNGVFGLEGLAYGMPNVGDDEESLNTTCVYLFNVIGKNLFTIMHHEDADLTTPPSINTITRLRNLCRRARQILAARVVADNKPKMEAVHSTPAPEPFLVYPCPFWLVRNPHLKEYARYMFSCLAEIAQHTDTRKSYDIGPQLGGLVGQYVHRVQKLVATELLGQPPEAADALDFDISDEILATYNPGQWFTLTEMVDTPPAFFDIPTEDDLTVLTRGIAVSAAKAFAVEWPTGVVSGEGRAAAQSTASFPAPPTP